MTESISRIPSSGDLIVCGQMIDVLCINTQISSMTHHGNKNNSGRPTDILILSLVVFLSFGYIVESKVHTKHLFNKAPMNDTQIKHLFLQKLKQMLRTWHSYMYIALRLHQNSGSYLLCHYYWQQTCWKSKV